MNRVLIGVVVVIVIAALAGIFLLPDSAITPAGNAERAGPTPDAVSAPVLPTLPVPEAPKRTSERPPPAPVAPRRPAPAPPPVEVTTGTLRVVSDVPGAQVFLDRNFIGSTPTVAKDVAPGSHQLNVSAPGFDNHVATIDVEPGEREVVVNFRQVRLNVALDVVHKHRLGSCHGRLVATAAGLRYETTNKDDAFSTTLLDIEALDVDYLNKNLRIQPRKGKRYDFTDPNGDADKLFVFHRDVSRARERLKKGDVPTTN